MSSTCDSSHLFRFATFEVNIAAGELRKDGIKLRIQDQPLRLLALLLARPGELLTREELRKGLWSDTYVEFDTALNTTVKRLRNVLNDSAEHSRFIQTVGSRGYRFVYPVEIISPVPQAGGGESAQPPLPCWPVAQRKSRLVQPLSLGVVLAGSLLVVLSLYVRTTRSRNVAPAYIHSLAVLPIESLSSDPSQAYFADGLTDQLITELGEVGNVRVISRTSIMQYKGTHKRLGEIAQELNVDAIVEGTILRSGNRVRISAQLIQAPADTHLWARSYDGDLNNALSLQEKVAEDIASHIEEHVPAPPRQAESPAHFVSDDAYDVYLQARYLEEQHTPEALQKAIQYFKKAIQYDPKYALAYVGLAHSYQELSYRDVLPPGKVAKIAEADAEKALLLDDSLAEAHTAVATLKWASLEWDGNRAERELKRAIQLNPSCAPAHDVYAYVLSSEGRADEAVAEAKRNLELNPLSIGARSHLGDAYYFAHRYSDAIEQHRRALELYPKAFEPNQDLALDYLVTGMYSDFLTQAEHWMDLAGETSSRLAAAQIHQLKRTDHQGAVKILIRQALAQRKSAYASSTWIATLYAQNHQTESALTWLETSYNERDPNLLYLAVDPAFDNVRTDPRFHALVSRVQ